MLRKLSIAVAGLFMLVATAGLAGAQTSVTTTVTVNVPEVLRLEITGSADFVLDPTAFDGGATSVVVDASTTPTVSVTANRNWQLSAQADAAAWSYSGAHAAQTPTKDASDLAVGLTGPGSWTIAHGVASKWALGTSSESLATGGRGLTSGAIVYSLTHNLGDWPGDYTLSVTYTLAGN